jgi:hypothetical protein
VAIWSGHRGRYDKEGDQMFEVIDWKAYLKAKTEDKAKFLLKRFEKTIELKVELKNCVQYWKDDTLYEARFTTELKVEEISNAIFESLLIGKKISYSWQVFGPNNSNQYWDFEALTDKTIIPGVEWVSYRISNNSE